MHEDLEDHLKKQLQVIKSSDESRHLKLQVENHFLSSSFRDRREAGSGIIFDDGEDPDDGQEVYEEYNGETEAHTRGVPYKSLKGVDILPTLVYIIYLLNIYSINEIYKIFIILFLNY